MAGNKSLHDANRAKKDEFYTQINDIANELKHYTEHFRGKTVFCNCDDPLESNFFKYFALKFNDSDLGLKRLIATSYDGSSIAGTELNFENNLQLESKARKIIVDKVEDNNGDGAIDEEDVKILLQRHPPKTLTSNDNFKAGDFRSNECIKLLEQADIVVTNPPFSLFREYVAQLVEYNEKFLIVGNQNAITYKEIFKLIKENKIWLGFHTGHTWFRAPDTYEIPARYLTYDKKKMRSNGYRIDEDGKKWRNLGNICWFTNLDHNKRHENLDLYKHYTPEEYPKYDNYDAINVDKTADIPMDYKGVMGVPITFLDKYNPEQFEIVALGIVGSCNFTCEKKMEILDKNGRGTGKYTINAKGTLYKVFNPEKDKKPAFKDVKTGCLYASIYARILIRNKKL